MTFLSTFLLMCMISCAALQQSLPNIGRWWIVAVDFTFTFCHFFSSWFSVTLFTRHPTGSIGRWVFHRLGIFFGFLQCISFFFLSHFCRKHFLRALNDGLLQCCWKVLDLPKNCKKGIGSRTKIMVPNYLYTNWKSLSYWSVEPSPITMIF